MSNIALARWLGSLGRDGRLGMVFSRKIQGVVLTGFQCFVWVATGAAHRTAIYVPAVNPIATGRKLDRLERPSRKAGVGQVTSHAAERMTARDRRQPGGSFKLTHYPLPSSMA